jgi:hypothetical protein
MTRTPDNGFTFLCAVVANQMVLMQWFGYVRLAHCDHCRYAPRKKFMKLKDFETPFEGAPPMMDLLVLKDRPLPVLCVVCFTVSVPSLILIGSNSRKEDASQGTVYYRPQCVC